MHMHIYTHKAMLSLRPSEAPRPEAFRARGDLQPSGGVHLQQLARSFKQRSMAPKAKSLAILGSCAQKSRQDKQQ